MFTWKFSFANKALYSNTSSNYFEHLQKLQLHNIYCKIYAYNMQLLD